MKYTINTEKVVFDDHYKIIKAAVTYDSFDSGSISTSRLAFERGDSVAILLLEKDTGSILFTEQFRYPTCKNNPGWLLEIPAGSLEKDEKPKDCIIREVNEELGYSLKNPRLINTFYSSPGASTERIFLFYEEVFQSYKTDKGGGKASENEDIKLVKFPLEELDDLLSGKIMDAKSIIALQFLKLNILPTLKF